MQTRIQDFLDKNNIITILGIPLLLLGIIYILSVKFVIRMVKEKLDCRRKVGSIITPIYMLTLLEFFLNL